MLGMAIVDHKPHIPHAKRDGKIHFSLSKRRWVEIDWEILSLDIVSGRRDASEMLLAQRNRRHTLMEDNPSSD